ncbi:hypothetical protein M3Y94_01081800 [Aphelenchoides besseyi]|nr:hypothetical protein M3Y94_01081800 [Aphelenchoides besseyi]KAI6218799.1 putative serine/threonine-protein kinase [Aphelenchoides besseyi]
MPQHKPTKKLHRRHRSRQPKPSSVPSNQSPAPHEEPAEDPHNYMQLAKDVAYTQARLVRNTKIRTENAEYNVVREVCVGTFGFTYFVKQTGGNNYYMRTEPMTVNSDLRTFKILKAELFILRKCLQLDRAATGHFVRLYDSGCNDEFKFIITQALGDTLHDITRKKLRSAFSPSTALRVSIQMFRALLDLHQIGFIHRFVRPQAFAVGLGSKIRTVFLADCGLPWQFRDPSGKGIRSPRKHIRMMGSLRYMSHNVHTNVEQARCDDLESWVYLSMEFFDLMCLPWRDERDSTIVLHKKRKLINGQYPMAFTNSSVRYKNILDYLAILKYDSHPDYATMQEILHDICIERCLDFNLPYDWENLTSQPPVRPIAPPVPQPIAQPLINSPVEPPIVMPTPTVTSTLTITSTPTEPSTFRTEPTTNTIDSPKSQDVGEEEKKQQTPTEKPSAKKSPTVEEEPAKLPEPKKPLSLPPTQLPAPPNVAQAEVQQPASNYVANTSIGNRPTVDKVIVANMASGCNNLADERPKPPGTPKSSSEGSPSSNPTLP